MERGVGGSSRPLLIYPSDSAPSDYPPPPRLRPLRIHPSDSAPTDSPPLTPPPLLLSL